MPRSERVVEERERRTYVKGRNDGVRSGAARSVASPAPTVHQPTQTPNYACKLPLTFSFPFKLAKYKICSLDATSGIVMSSSVSSRLRGRCSLNGGVCGWAGAGRSAAPGTRSPSGPVYPWMRRKLLEIPVLGAGDTKSEQNKNLIRLKLRAKKAEANTHPYLGRQWPIGSLPNVNGKLEVDAFSWQMSLASIRMILRWLTKLSHRCFDMSSERISKQSHGRGELAEKLFPASSYCCCCWCCWWRAMQLARLFLSNCDLPGKCTLAARTGCHLLWGAWQL